MKLSLRNLALAGAMMVAGAAMAQDAPFNVTVDWFRTMTGNTNNEYRFGTGWGGKVIATNKTTSTIHFFDKENETVVDAQGSVAVNCIPDEAGHLLFHRSWAGASDVAKWTIYNPADGTFTDVEITTPEGAEIGTGRMDQIGRVIGDVLSDEGGLMIFTPQNATLPYIIKIANGVQVEPGFTDYPVAETGPYSFDSTTIGQFTYTFDEVQDMGDDWVNAIAIRARGQLVPSVNVDGEWGAMASVPGAKSSEGFDVFVLNDKLYLVNPAGDVNYTSRFKIVDVETGEVVYTLPEEYEVSVAGGQGFGSITANKVSENKVEIYIFGQTAANPGKTYAGMVTVEIPGGEVPPTVDLPGNIFLRGSMMDWNVEWSYMLMPQFDVEAPVANENGEYEYKLYLDALFGDWKISGPEADWSGFNYGGKGEDHAVEAGKTLEAWSGSSENFTMGNLTLTEATVTFYYNPDNTKPSYVKVEGTPYVEAPQLPNFIFLRGEMTDWAGEYSYALMPKFDIDAPVANENGEYEYSAYLDVLFGEFKFGDQNGWDLVDLGGKEAGVKVAGGNTYELVRGGANLAVDGEALTEVTLTLYYNPDSSKSSWLKVEGTSYVAPVTTTDKAHFVYNLTAEKGENNAYTLNFKSTGDAAKAVLVLTEKADGSEIEEELGEIKKGDNTFTYDASKLAEEKSYNWAIRVHNYKVEETKISEPINVGGNRAGLVVFTDPQYPEVFGKVAIGRTKNGGIDVYDAEGNLIAEGVHKNNAAMGGTGANNSSPMHGTARGNEALFASWGDAACGVVAVDIANLDAEPYSVFEGVKEASGAINNNGVYTGSGTPCVALAGSGENTKMFVFDEDIFGNTLAYSEIGTAKTVGTALISTGVKNLLANTNVAAYGMENGVFLSQVRANGMEVGTPGICYYDINDAAVIWKGSDEAMYDENFLPSAAAGVAVNPAGDLLAVATYTGVEVYLLDWEDKYPLPTKYMSIESPYATGSRTNLAFDAANNIHVTNQVNGYYTITLAEEEPIAHVAAPASSTIEFATGVENINIEAAAEGEAVYYNLNGVRVDAKAMTPGVYVKAQNGKATKVVVK